MPAKKAVKRQTIAASENSTVVKKQKGKPSCLYFLVRLKVPLLCHLNILNFVVEVS